MASTVMTVLGSISADELGPTLTHEHLLIDLYREAPDGNHLMNEIPLAVAEARRLREAGGRTLVDVTNRDLGRNPRGLQTIAREAGIHIVMGCGWYREPFFERSVFEQTTNQVAEGIVRDITQGIDGTDVRAGIIGEIGSDRGRVTPAEERSFRAAARAHRQTGLTISTHAERSTVGLWQLEILQEEGVDPRRVIVGHCDSYPDSDYHEALARKGAYVQFDTIRGLNEWDTRCRVDWLLALLQKGYLSQVLLSHDVCARQHLHAYGGNGYDYILTGFVPRLLQAGLSPEQVHILTVENPRRALTGERA